MNWVVNRQQSNKHRKRNMTRYKQNPEINVLPPVTMSNRQYSTNKAQKCASNEEVPSFRMNSTLSSAIVPQKKAIMEQLQCQIPQKLRRFVSRRANRFMTMEPQIKTTYFMEQLRNTQESEDFSPYKDYETELAEVSRMRQRISVEVMKPINLEKKVSHSKTVVLDLDQTLAHCSRNGIGQVRLTVRLAGEQKEADVNIRPGAAKFLQDLSEIAEIIVFTAGYPGYADPVLDHIDTNKVISHRLYRDHCTFSHGIHLKDLRRLNRQLSDIVIVDNSVYCYLLQLENGIPITPYFGGDEDTQLQKLLQYLKILLRQPDIRKHNSDHFGLQKYKCRSRIR